MSKLVQWFLMDNPVEEDEVILKYRVEVDGQIVKSVPRFIRNHLDEIEILEHEISILQNNALKRMDELQNRVDRYEETMSQMAKEIKKGEQYKELMEQMGEELKRKDDYEDIINQLSKKLRKTEEERDSYKHQYELLIRE